MKYLEDVAAEEGVSNSVHFEINLSIEKVIDIMAQAKVGIHTMKNEHFGIAIVEMMAAGVITIAHESGGPLRDIIQKGKSRGYLWKSTNDYATAMFTALNFYNTSLHTAMRQNAREVAQVEFSDEAFMDKFRRHFVDVIHSL